MMEEIYFQRVSDVLVRHLWEVKAFAPKLCDLSSVPEIHMVDSHRLFSDLPHTGRRAALASPTAMRK